MRTQLELWQVVKDNFDEYFKTGLCLLIFQLRYRNIINYEEKFLLEKELIEYGNYETGPFGSSISRGDFFNNFNYPFRILLEKIK